MPADARTVITEEQNIHSTNKQISFKVPSFLYLSCTMRVKKKHTICRAGFEQ